MKRDKWWVYDENPTPTGLLQHDCTYVRTRNLLIAEAIRVTREELGAEKTDVWDRRYLQLMGELYRAYEESRSSIKV